MANFYKSVSTRWQDSANVILGAWLFVSPWLLSFTTNRYAFWNALIFGVVLAVAALAALVDQHLWEEWVDMICGAWLVISPWALGFAMATPATLPATGAATAAAPAVSAAAPVWNFVIVGVLAVVLAAWSLIENRHRITTSA